MKKITLLALVAVLAVPALVQADTFSLRIGYYMPKAASLSYAAKYPDSLWGIEFNQMSFDPEHYRNSVMGGSYEMFLNKYASLVFSLDTYSRDDYGYYRDWVGYALTDGDFAFPYPDFTGEFDITHVFNVYMTPIQLSVKFTPLGRKTRVIPYIGGGVGAYFWGATIRGQIVDFSQEYVYTDPDTLIEYSVYPVTQTYTRERRVSIGYQGFVGLSFPIGYRVTIDGEVRYHYLQGRFKSDFIDFDKFDLSGLALSVGFSYWF